MFLIAIGIAVFLRKDTLSPLKKQYDYFDTSNICTEFFANYVSKTNMKLLKKSASLLLPACLAFSIPLTSLAQTGFHVIKSISIPSAGGWDYIMADGEGQRVYVSHGNQVNIISTTTGDSIGYIPNTQGVHGIALAKPFGKGYVTDGRANAVTIFDIKTLKVLGTVPVGQNPDAIFYDDYSKKIITCNGRSKDATIFDPETDKVVATVPLGDKPETAVSDGKGKIFVNGENTSTVIVFDANTYKEIARYKIDGGESPSGLDIDRKTNRLFIGCGDTKTMVVMDASNGKTIGKFPIGGTDGLVFDPKLKLIFVSNGEGTISVIREINADKFESVETIPTERGARTIGIDLVAHHLYLPTAKSEPVAPTTENPHPRPKMIVGTFHVLEVGK
jgi:YVTN family beta-propeller protein